MSYKFINNTDGIAENLEHADMDDVLLGLGDKEIVRTSGVIRPGIKVLKNSTEKERIIYEKLVAEGELSFDEIDIKLGGKPKSKDSKLTPLNVDYFSVRRNDFPNKDDASLINKYADADGKIRNIPVWLPEDKIYKVIPHRYSAFGGDGRVKCFSKYVGEELVCHYISKEEQDNAYKENRRPKFLMRPCLPDTCKEYRAKKCRFGGMIKCNIPYLSGMGEVVIPTKSWNGLSYIMANLKRIRKVLGRFSGLVKDDTFLEMKKVRVGVTLPNGSKGKQWVVTIEPSVSLFELAQFASKTAFIARPITTSVDVLEDGETDYIEDGETTSKKPVEPPPSPSARTKIVELFKSLAVNNSIEYELLYKYAQNCGVDLEKDEIDRVKGIYDELTVIVKEDLQGFISFLKIKFPPVKQDTGVDAKETPVESKPIEKKASGVSEDKKADAKETYGSDAMIGLSGKSELFAFATKKGMKIPDVKKYVKGKYNRDDVIKLTQNELKQIKDYIASKEKAA